MSGNEDTESRNKELDLHHELELAKINNEREAKLRELAIAERRMALDEKATTGQWTMEFKTGLISIVTAVIAALGTFTGAYYSGLFDVAKTNASSAASINLEKLKFSNDLIKTALSSNNSANSLLFYADIGLLEGLRSDSVKTYAEKENNRIKQGDQGPSLLPSFAHAAASKSTVWLDADLVKAIAPNANQDIMIPLTTIGNYLFTGFDINKNAKRLAMFLGQIAHETAGFSIFIEKANFSENRLPMLWPKQFDKQSAKEYANNPEKILNRAYANKYGNGDEASGDGFRFRGRGYFLITGRANYERMAKETGIDIVKNPDLASDPNVALLIATSYWYNSNLNEIADEGNIDQISKKISGGTQGLESRHRYTENALNALRGKLKPHPKERESEAQLRDADGHETTQ
jgi:putative chitinase